MTLLAPSVPLNYYVTNSDTPGVSAFGTTVTTGGSTHGKGSWVAIHSTITYDLYWHTVSFAGLFESTFARLGLADLGVGPDSSNVTVIAENLIVEAAGSPSIAGTRSIYLPLFVPAGTQLWARAQGSNPNDVVYCAIQSWGGPGCPVPSPPVFIQAIGAATGTSSGVTYTPGSSGAAGSYAQMIASSVSDYIAVMGMAGTTDTSMGSNSYSISVGLGAATEFDAGLTEITTRNSTENMWGQTWPVYFSVPAGTRIALRGSCGGTPDSSNFASAYGFVGG